jgi:hypothetical protein
MRVFAVAFVALVLLAPPARAQPPVIGAYAELSDCRLFDAPGEFQSVWLVHETGPAVQAARFRVEVVDNGWTASYIGAWYPVIYVVDPDPFSGATFGVPECGGPPNVFARLDFLSLAPSPQCAAEIVVAPDPTASSGQIEAIDCNGNVLLGESGTKVVVNSDPDTCPCVSGPLETSESTWGRVKSLYR